MFKILLVDQFALGRPKYHISSASLHISHSIVTCATFLQISIFESITNVKLACFYFNFVYLS